MENKPTIVVIGAGIIGLTSAVRIQDYLLQTQRQCNVLIVAAELPQPISSLTSVNYASMWAGAHLRPIPVDSAQLRTEAKWFRCTVKTLRKQLQKEPWAGILPLRGIEYLAAPSNAYREFVQDRTTFYEETLLEEMQVLEKDQLPHGMAMGYEYNTFCLNAPVYCMSLMRKFLLRGGKTLIRKLSSEHEAFTIAKDTKLVVNASGVGFRDPKSFPTRGQICLVANNWNSTITQQNADGTWTFIIPRCFEGGTIIGGTKEPNNWDIEASLENRHQILRKAATLCPEIKNESGGFDVLADVVGRRPTREGGLRLEVESAIGPEGKEVHIVHAYGAGGRGYELSWGVAEEVLGLVNTTLQQQEQQQRCQLKPSL